MTRKQILDQVAAGEISVAEAEALILGSSEAGTAVGTEPETTSDSPTGHESGRRRRTGPSVDERVAFAAHGISSDYVRDLYAAGIDDLPTHEVIALASNGVSVELLGQLREAGFGNFAVQELIGLSMNRVTPDFIKELSQAELTSLTAGDLIALGTSGVRPSAIAELRRAGLDRFSVQELTGMVLNGVDSKLVRESGKELASLTAAELIALGASKSKSKREAPANSGKTR